MSNWNYVIAAHLVTWVTLALYYRSVARRRARAAEQLREPRT